ncbi:hypothetical protein [Streptomyces ziwulingensis]|uniref:RNA polymerase sigma factor 70 region 4 type 2 domain-containing protein n=1 Tax=Streptomyces ziwulingensis TaxID=1045501 RepID=A0ABP9BW64_9ACTN
MSPPAVRQATCAPTARPTAVAPRPAVVPQRRGAARPAWPRSQSPLTPALPPAFEAFCALHRDRWLDYARAHLPEGRAHRLVREMLGELAVTWAQIVGHPNPAARAWSLLSTRVHESRPLPPPLAVRAAEQHDALVLHCLLGYSSGDTAAVMGRDPSKIRYLVCSAPADCRRAVRQLRPGLAGDAG